MTADRVVIWNQHNDRHHDRGTLECNLSLVREGQEVWRQDQIALPWSAERDENVSINVPNLRFDRVRVEITKWEQASGGLAEIEVYRGEANLARGCPATACAQLNSRFTADKLTDGIVTGYFDSFWLLPDRMPGWAEIDLSLAEPRASAGVRADRLILWNTHNSRHNDRGAVAVNLRLSLGQKEVWRQDDVAVPWSPDQDTSVEVELPQLPFDRVRVEVTRWPALGAGLSEIQVMQGSHNLARACPVVSSGCLNHNFRPENTVDGITSSLTEELGYWCAPDRSDGWIEIDLSCNDPSIGEANQKLGAYRALVEHDWPRALPWLARSDSRELRKLALLDASNPGDPHEQAAIGDGWWDAADASDDPAKPVLRQRAAFRYAQAMMRLGEAERARPMERIAATLPLAEGTPLFLLPETELKGVGYLREPIVLLRGVPRPLGLWAHPGANQPTLAAFSLAKKYHRFAGAAAINDTAQQGAQTPLTFRILGDGRAIWTSQPLQQTSSAEPFDIDVSGFERLELIVDCPGDNAFCHAVWIDPILDPTSSWPGIHVGPAPPQLAATSAKIDRPTMTDGDAPPPRPSNNLAPGESAPSGTAPTNAAPSGRPPRLAELAKDPEKLPPPDEAARKAAEQELKQRYKTEWLGKGASGRLGSARILAKAAEKEADSPTDQFVLLSQACDLAAKTGNYSAAAEFIDQLAERFVVSPLAMRADALADINRVQKVAAQKQPLVDNALFLVADSLQADDYATAEQAAKLAALAARGANDAVRAEAAKQCVKDVSELARHYKSLHAAVERLHEEADDAEANLKLGMFECMLKHDWQHGLPRLARGSDEALRQLAQRDLQSPVEPSARLGLAQAWFEWAAGSKDETKLACQSRALEWYELAAPACRGDDRQQADERIAEIGGSGAFQARPLRWLERLRLGVEVDEEIDCTSASKSFDLGKTFDIGKSWVLTLEFLARDITSPGVAFFIGDDRGGRDPIVVSLLDDGRLYVRVSDSGDETASYELTCPLNAQDSRRWKHVRVNYRDSDRSVTVELDGEPAASGVLNFVPAIDRPMLCWVGGVNSWDQRFSGKVRRVRLTN
ncbi:MAG TPA: NPCBM/NEW2 domain-containing protein [Pirellulales bacterium]|nr:NPCBM/NEW2 domain-containing protein [Pirellulales bacterium]